MCTLTIIAFSIVICCLLLWVLALDDKLEDYKSGIK